MLWLIITLISYFLLAAVYLIDKHLLTSTLPSPRIYTFYVGILAMVIIVVAPFIHFYVPPVKQLILSLFAGIVFAYCLLWFYKALSLFEASRIVPATGALGPILTLILIFLLSGGREKIGMIELISLLFLIVGTFLITIEKGKRINWASLRYAFIIAFLFAVYLVASKQVYLSQPFLNGLIWIKCGGLIFSLFLFIFYPEVRKSIHFKIKDEKISKKTFLIFIGNQIMGGGSGLLQNWAIALAPVIYVPMITALQGAQYVFLLLLVGFLSLKMPKLIYEEMNRSVLFQKIVATILITIGIGLLALK